ncbi:MAG: chromate resistance protein ChrB domain-containing protein [Gammaproteobacteria bacterium]
MSAILRKALWAMGLIAWANSSVAEGKIVFSTWDTFEVDKCASIWLIKSRIAPQAEFRFFKKGEPITEGIEFDTPNASFRRFHNKSTFETLLDHYQLNDEKLLYLGRIIHDIEVNIWEKKIMKETPSLEKAVAVIIAETDKEKLVEDCYQFFSGFEASELQPK